MEEKKGNKSEATEKIVCNVLRYVNIINKRFTGREYIHRKETRGRITMKKEVNKLIYAVISLLGSFQYIYPCLMVNSFEPARGLAN